jgi:hypothetical protein
LDFNEPGHAAAAAAYRKRNKPVRHMGAELVLTRFIDFINKKSAPTMLKIIR